MQWKPKDQPAWVTSYVADPKLALPIDYGAGWPYLEIPYSVPPQVKASKAADFLQEDLAVLQALQCMWNYVWREATGTPNYLVAMVLSGGLPASDGDQIAKLMSDPVAASLAKPPPKSWSKTLAALDPKFASLAKVSQPSTTSVAASLGMGWSWWMDTRQCNANFVSVQKKASELFQYTWWNARIDALLSTEPQSVPAGQATPPKADVALEGRQTVLGAFAARAWERFAWAKLLGGTLTTLGSQPGKSPLLVEKASGPPLQDFHRLWASELVAADSVTGCLPLVVGAWWAQRHAWGWSGVPTDVLVKGGGSIKALANLWKKPITWQSNAGLLPAMPPLAVRCITAAAASVAAVWRHFSKKGWPNDWHKVAAQVPAPLSALDLAMSVGNLDKNAIPNLIALGNQMDSMPNAVFAVDALAIRAYQAWRRARTMLAVLISVQGLSAADAKWILPLMRSWSALAVVAGLAHQQPTMVAGKAFHNRVMAYAQTPQDWAAAVIDSPVLPKVM